MLALVLDVVALACAAALWLTGDLLFWMLAGACVIAARAWLRPGGPGPAITTAVVAISGASYLGVDRGRAAVGDPALRAALMVSLVLVVVSAQSYRVGRLSQAVAGLVATDGLTGLVGREGFDRQLRLEVAKALRYKRPLALVLADVDSLRGINERAGRAVGDEVLLQVSHTLTSQSRAGELAARVSGDRLAWILPETDGDGAVVAAERLRAAVAELEVRGAPVSVSLGVADLDGIRGGADLDGISGGAELMARAERSLARARDEGRNRVELAR